jgi:hypothetical protein
VLQGESLAKVSRTSDAGGGASDFVSAMPSLRKHEFSTPKGAMAARPRRTFRSSPSLHGCSNWCPAPCLPASWKPNQSSTFKC